MLTGRALRIYVAASALLIVAFLLAPPGVKPWLFLAAPVGAIPCVWYGLTVVRPGKRSPWALLLAALTVLSLGLVVRIGEGGNERLGLLLNASGNVLLFVAAVALILRCGRTDVGGVIDASIIGLALGGLLCIAVFGMTSPVQGAAEANLFVVLVTLSGVLGALHRAATVLTQPVAALRWVMLGLALALVAHVVQASSTATDATDALFMAAYTSVGVFGLHRTAPRLVRPGFVNRTDALTMGRLVFLGIAVAVVPVVVGALIFLDRATARDGAVVLVVAALVAGLVMTRVGRLSADRSRVELALRQQATADPLTGLPNRRTFLERLSTALGHQRCAVLFCDLDGFKEVNDRWGHGVGDELLGQVAKRLVASVRDTDTVSRFGGDEFLILLIDADHANIDGVISRLRTAFSAPFPLSRAELTLGVSIGVATSIAGPAEDLVGAADALMYEAKRMQGATPSVRVAA